MTGRIVPFRQRPAARGGPTGAPDLASGGNGATSDRGPFPPRPGSGGTVTSIIGPSPAPRFRELVLPHLDSAYSLARYLSRDATAAEDIAQEAMLKAIKGFGGFRGEEPKAWLLARVRHAFLDWARDR